ncbi:MAG: hypothetical protein D6776_05410 [Planctomycetota bacterium]|nr:MAG: hypothetical protein D6776_05410 [Planctomycetota bacterium]
MTSAALQPFQFFSVNYLALVLIAALCATAGVFVVCRRVVFIGLALVESAALGVGFAFWSFGWIAAAGTLGAWWHTAGVPLSAVVFALLGTLVFSWQPRGGRVSGEAVVGAGYAVAAGLALLLVWNSAEGLEELQHLLRGDVLFVRPSQVMALGGLVLAVFGALALWHRPVLFSLFDPDMAASLGFRAGAWQRATFLAIGLVISLSAWTGGALLVFAMLVLPAVGALALADRFWQAVRLAIAFAVTAVTLGFWLAAHYNDPTPPAVIAVALGLLVTGALETRFGLRGLGRGVLAAGALGTLLCVAVAAADQLGHPLLPRQQTSSGAVARASHEHRHPAGDSSLDKVRARLHAAEPDTRLAAVRALCARGDLQAAALLHEALGDEDATVVAAALEALGTCSDRARSADAVARAAARLSPDLQLEAARLLLGWNDPRGIERLLAILASPDAAPFVRSDAVALLREHARTRFDYDPFAPPDSQANRSAIAAWRHWFEEHARGGESR